MPNNKETKINGKKKHHAGTGGSRSPTEATTGLLIKHVRGTSEFDDTQNSARLHC
jgi:hypothetical protein